MKSTVLMENPRYSQHARRSLRHARMLAEKYAHNEIDTDHLLAGIWLTEGSFGWQILCDFPFEVETVEHIISQLHPQADSLKPPSYGAAVEAALELAKDESYWLGHHYIGTEHILLGLVRAGQGRSPMLFDYLNIQGSQIRRRVRRLLNEGVSELSLEAVRRMARMSELTRRVLNAAIKLADDHHHPGVSVEHLLLVLARERRSMASRILMELGMDAARLDADLDSLLLATKLTSTAVDDLIDRAVDQAESLGMHYMGTDHILLVMTSNDEASDLMRRYNVDAEVLRERLTESLNI